MSERTTRVARSFCVVMIVCRPKRDNCLLAHSPRVSVVFRSSTPGTAMKSIGKYSNVLGVIWITEAQNSFPIDTKGVHSHFHNDQTLHAKYKQTQLSLCHVSRPSLNAINASCWAAHKWIRRIRAMMLIMLLDSYCLICLLSFKQRYDSHDRRGGNLRLICSSYSMTMDGFKVIASFSERIYFGPKCTWPSCHCVYSI